MKKSFCQKFAYLTKLWEGIRIMILFDHTEKNPLTCSYICATTSKKTFVTPNIYSSVAAEDIRIVALLLSGQPSETLL